MLHTVEQVLQKCKAIEHKAKLLEDVSNVLDKKDLQVNYLLEDIQALCRDIANDIQVED